MATNFESGHVEKAIREAVPGMGGMSVRLAASAAIDALDQLRIATGFTKRFDEAGVDAVTVYPKAQGETELAVKGPNNMVVEVPASQVPNTTFHTFKPSGKWYTTGRGHADRQLFIETHTAYERWARILELNNGRIPGMSSPGADMLIVIIPDDSVEGFPIMLHQQRRTR